jgi:hypothetical protein
MCVAWYIAPHIDKNDTNSDFGKVSAYAIGHDRIGLRVEIFDVAGSGCFGV